MDEQSDEDHAQDDDGGVEAMEVFPQDDPAWPKLQPCIGQSPAPGEGPEEGVNVEPRHVHARDSGRKRDKRPHHGEEAGQEHGAFSIAGKEAVGDIQVVMRNKNKAAVPFDQRTPAPGAEVISHQRPRIAAQGTCQRHPGDAEPPHRDQVTRKRHNDFRGQRDAR